MRNSSRSAPKTLLADYAAMPTSPKPVAPTHAVTEVSHKGPHRSDVNETARRDVNEAAHREAQEHERGESTAKRVGQAPIEIGGRVGPEPTRFGDWEKNGRCIDF
jgi:hypothetical protein